MEQQNTIEIKASPLYDKANAVLRLLDGFDQFLYDGTDFETSSIVFNKKEGIYSILTHLEYDRISSTDIGDSEDDVVNYLINERILFFANQEEDSEEETIQRCYLALLNRLPESQYATIVSPILNKSFVLTDKEKETSFSFHTSQSENTPSDLRASLSIGHQKASVIIKDALNKIEAFQEDFGKGFLNLQLGIPIALAFEDEKAKINASVNEDGIVWKTEMEDSSIGKHLSNEFLTGITALDDLMDFFNDFILYQGLPIPK